MPSFYAKRCTIFRTFKWLTKRDNHIKKILLNARRDGKHLPPLSKGEIRYATQKRQKTQDS